MKGPKEALLTNAFFGPTKAVNLAIQNSSFCQTALEVGDSPLFDVGFGFAARLALILLAIMHATRVVESRNLELHFSGSGDGEALGGWV